MDFEDEAAENFIVNLETVLNADGSISIQGHVESNYLEIVRYDTDRHSFTEF